MKFFRKNKKGFSLMELTVVVVVIGILAAVAMSQYGKSTERARMTEAMDILSHIRNMQESRDLLGDINGNTGYTTNFSLLGEVVAGKGTPNSSTLSTENYKYTLRAGNYADAERIDSNMVYTLRLRTNYTSPQICCTGRDCGKLSGVVEDCAGSSS